MKSTHLFQLGLALLLGWSTLAQFAVADDPDTPPANQILIQDEDKELSRVQTVFYSAEREASIELLVMGAVELGQDETLVTVISPDGAAERISSAGQPVVKIQNVRQGLHAIVASSSSTHGTKLVNFQPEEKKDEAPDVPEIDGAPKPTPPARMTLAVTSADVLRPFVDRIRGLSHDAADSEFVDASISPESFFDYQVALRSDGTLFGQVYTVFKNPASVSVDGTEIGIFQNGSLVKSTTCDARGDFEIPEFEPGVYGLIASGPAGYAAFAFKAEADAAAIAGNGTAGKKFVNTLQPRGVLLPKLLPVVLIPPSMIPEVLDALEETFAALRWRTDITQSAPFGVPVGGSMVTPTSTAAGGGGGVGGSGGVGSGVGLTGLSALAGAAGFVNGGGNQGLPPPPVASPVIPGTQNGTDN